MTSMPPFPSLINKNLPGGQRPHLVDAIGPLVLSDPHQPHIKMTLTSFEDNQLDLTARHLGSQLLAELHVADLMTVSTGSLIQERRSLRHPASFMQRLKVDLDMATQEIVTFGDLVEVFGPNGWHGLRSPWKVVRELKCIRFVTSTGMTVLIPCLDAWRFTFAFTSHILTSSVHSATGPTLTKARADSTLTTPDGQTISLPLALNGQEREDVVTASTLNLVVPKGYGHADLTALAWLFTDDQAFAAMTRFYTSVIAATTTQGRTGVARFSAPPFVLPFQGSTSFTLFGTQQGQTFLCLHIARCAAKLALPHTLTHNLAPDTSSDLPVPDHPSTEARYRGRRPPPPDDKTEMDSLTPPNPRLATLHLGLRQDRFGPLKDMTIKSRQDPESSHSVHVVGDVSEPDTLVSGGTKKTRGRGGRQVNTVEQPPFVPPPSRPIDHLVQFCDLQGVCEELEKAAIRCDWISLNRPGSTDPTTAIPTEAGSASTWVGQGIQARRVLVVCLRWEKHTAYALEWERVSGREYGRLLLCSASTRDLSRITLLSVISKCAERRGVWPETSPGIPFIHGISHRTPYRTAMSAQIISWLQTI